MIKYALPVAVAYFAVASAAWALPSSTLTQLTSPNDIVQVGSKSHKKHSYKKHYDKHHYKYGKYDKKYHYHGRYWGHRYAHRPYGWQTMGCIAAGPFWYCP